MRVMSGTIFDSQIIDKRERQDKEQHCGCLLHVNSYDVWHGSLTGSLV